MMGLLKKSWFCDRMQGYPLAREGNSPRCRDAGGAGEPHDPMVHRLRAARASVGSFEPDAYPSALGEKRFREIFRRKVVACLVAKDEVVQVNTSLLRADVSWESLMERHVDEVMAENGVGEKDEDGGGPGGKGKASKVSRTDPDAIFIRKNP